MPSSFDVEKIREDFPFLKRKIYGRTQIYLDNAATTQKPGQVIERLVDYYENHNANVHRGVHRLSQEASEMYEDAHKTVGSFVNAKHPMEETVFLRNSTEAINLVMHSWAKQNLEADDEVLSTVMEHHSNIVPWQMMHRLGAKVKYVDVKKDGTLDMDDLNEKISNRTKLVTCMHSSNVVGTINPVEEIGKIAHEHEARFLLDAAQSVPHMPVDFEKTGADFMVFSGHKMLAPTGIGALISKIEILEDMEPFMGGGDMIREVKLEKSRWNILPWKFEAGTPNIGGGIAFGAAVDYLKNIGMENVRRHEEELLEYGFHRFEELEKVEIYGPKDISTRGGLISFNIKGVHPHDVASILDSEFSVAIRSGHHCAQPLIEHLGKHASNRASFYIYNTKDEIDRLTEGIKKVKKIFKK